MRPKGEHRIEFEIWIDKKRYRPTIERPPTPANLRRARKQLDAIDQAIAAGTFDFAQEFPDYRLKGRLPALRAADLASGTSEVTSQPMLAGPLFASLEEALAPATATTAIATIPEQTCRDVFKAFLAHCQARVAMNDLAYSTWTSYQQILECGWAPRIGEERFLEVTYSRLAVGHLDVRRQSGALRGGR